MGLCGELVTDTAHPGAFVNQAIVFAAPSGYIFLLSVFYFSTERRYEAGTSVTWQVKAQCVRLPG